ncbi:MAG: hypothetical protein ACK5F7_13220, partial [Planctomycetaceae bacterium]
MRQIIGTVFPELGCLEPYRLLNAEAEFSSRKMREERQAAGAEKVFVAQGKFSLRGVRTATPTT